MFNARFDRRAEPGYHGHEMSPGFPAPPSFAVAQFDKENVVQSVVFDQLYPLQVYYVVRMVLVQFLQHRVAFLVA